jgi:hypothetical protein
MARHTIPIDRYIEATQVFHWFTREHIILWFLGFLKRHRRTESVLLKLVRKGKLRSVKYGKRLVYTVPRRTKGKLPVLLKEKSGYEPKITETAITGRGKIVHGLACTECLVRFYRSKLDGEIIAERFFYRLGAVPEWGIRCPNGKLLLLEYCTEDNFRHSNMMKGKINAYMRHLEKIEEKFQAEAIVVFVIDVPRGTVENFVGILKRDVGSVADDDQSALYEGESFPLNPFFFTDYKTFLGVPMGTQLIAPIYFWMDGKEYPLKKHD